MMARLVAAVSGCVLSLALSTNASATPVQIDFNVPGFGPVSGTTQTFTTSYLGLVTLTFSSLDEFLNPQGHLHWDANDGNGFADGFGVRDFPDRFTPHGIAPIGNSYSQDEIEGDERLRLSFGAPLSILSFNVTDFFTENESTLTGLPSCSPAVAECYREIGQYSLDEGLTWIGFLADPSQLRTTLTNGLLTIPVNQTASSVLFRAPGTLNVGGFSYSQLHEFSLAGVRVDPGTPFDVETPEPATLTLLSLGLAGLATRRRSR